MYHIRYLDITQSDFKDISHFYKNVINNKAYGNKIYKLITKKINGLITSPERCVTFNFKSNNPQYPSPKVYVYRKLIVENYIVIYTVDNEEKEIIIVRVVDARSDYQNYL